MKKVKKPYHKPHRFSGATALAIGLVTAAATFSGHGFGLISANTLGSTEFKDVPETDPNAVAIDFLQESEVIKGYEDGSFKPEGEINRAELMKILVEAQGVTPDPEEYKDCFTDIQDEWFAPYVCYAKDMGWVNGYEDGTFAPEKEVNKVEAIKMTVNSQGFSEDTEDCSADLYADTDANAWYGKYLCVAKEKGLLEEEEGETYAPTEEITRGAVAENIYRAITIKKLDKEFFNEEVKEKSDEALEEFKSEKEQIKKEIQTFKEELKQMKQEGLTEEDIKDQRKEFWEEVKSMQKEHKDNMKEMIDQLKDTREEFKDEREELKEIIKNCFENCDQKKQEFKEQKQEQRMEDRTEEPNKAPQKEPKTFSDDTSVKDETDCMRDANGGCKSLDDFGKDTHDFTDANKPSDTSSTKVEETKMEEPKAEEVK